MTSRLQLRVLGELRVVRDGVSLPLPASRKTRALLAYLAIVGQPVRRERLCELLWELPDDPRASLRWSLHKLRKLTNWDGQQRLMADTSHVALDPQSVDVDYVDISRLDLSRIEPLDVSTLEDIAGTFAGEFIEGISLPRCPKFEAWRRYHTDSLNRIRTRLLCRLITQTRDQPERRLFYATLLQRLSPEDNALPKEIQQLVSVAGQGKSGFAAEPVLSSSNDARPDLHSKYGQHTRGIEEQERESIPFVASSRIPQEIRFCRSRDGVQIAYAISGRGPPLVRAAHWMSHLQYEWESPVWRHWIDALSETNTLVRYDQRGNGLSDREVTNLSFEAMVSDLESVVDAARLDHFTLLGVSQSCSMSAAYAARWPERVNGLILYGGFVKGWRKRADRHEITTHEAMTALIREGWGKDNPAFRQLFTMMFIPGASQEQIAWFNELQRMTVSAEQAARLHDAFGEIDVSSVLPEITSPTLVIHATNDLVVPFYSGREFATKIRDARFVELESSNHILLANEPAFSEFREQVIRFVSQSAPVC